MTLTLETAAQEYVVENINLFMHQTAQYGNKPSPCLKGCRSCQYVRENDNSLINESALIPKVGIP